MLFFVFRHFRSLTLLLVGLLGLALGHLAATGLGVLLSPPVTAPPEAVQAKPVSAKKPALEDYQPILDRNLFNAGAPALLTSAPPPGTAPAAAPVPTRVDLTLFGTVAGSSRALAVVRAGGEVKILHLGDELPGEVTVKAISRNALTLVYPGGREETLYLYIEEETTPAPPVTKSDTPPTSASASIRSVGPNRWTVAAEAVEKARGNMGELLKQARLEPVVANGQTQGFVIRMIQPNSLFSLLGLQRGDVIKQVNGVELDSPEKALQIFQQLREARNISIGLTRNGTPQSFSYEIN